MMSRDNKRNVGKCMLAAAHDLTSAFSKNPINYSPLDECMINGQMIKGILFSVQNNYVGTIGVARKKKKNIHWQLLRSHQLRLLWACLESCSC
ncbi:hypothetical protein HanHA300_Chr13g0474121 [Helianthus annuus]|nr:hypothetical protein HanHA300_Chr13g0474121 [Helianthus annuus]